MIEVHQYIYACRITSLFIIPVMISATTVITLTHRHLWTGCTISSSESWAKKTTSWHDRS